MREGRALTELIYDNTWEGFLSAVFEAFARKRSYGRQTGVSIQAGRLADAGSLFPREEIRTDMAKAGRVGKGMEKLSRQTPGRVYTVWLSEQPGIDDTLAAFLKVGFDEKIDPMANTFHPAVEKVRGMEKKVGWEAHRMLQFVRFVQTGQGIYVADIKPEYNVLPLIGDHFHSRFGDQLLLIRDVTRRTVLVSDAREWYVRRLSDEEEMPPLPEDGQFEAMWRAYFKAIANPARKNLNLQRSFVPLKYREHLTEFQG